MNHVLAIWIRVLGLLLQTPVNSVLRPLSVVEAIDDCEKYADHTITVTGSLIATGEVVALSGSGCQPRMSTMKRQFACAISLALPDCHGAESRCTQEVQQVIRAVWRMRDSRERREIRLSLTGKLIVSSKVFVQWFPGLPYGEYMPKGFGHLNAFPVELIVVDGRVLSDRALSAPRNPSQHKLR